MFSVGCFGWGSITSAYVTWIIFDVIETMTGGNTASYTNPLLFLSMQEDVVAHSSGACKSMLQLTGQNM